jgi:hypothetical protein
MAAESKYDAKIIKYLDQKRGRSYQLGPELVVNGGFDSTAWWSKHANVTISDGVATLASVPTGNGVGKSGILTSGKTYLVAFDIVTVTAGAMYVYAGAVPAWSRGYSGKMSVTVQASGADFYLFTSGTTSCVLDNVSVREILL